MSKKIEKKAKKLIKEFHLVNEYKEFKKIQKAVKQNKFLNELSLKIDELKKRLPFSGKKVQQDIIRKINELKKEYNNHPLIVNYNQLKNMLVEVISPLTNLEL